MTTKRFHYRIDEIGIYYYVCDNTKKGDDRIILEFDSKFDAMEVCELLNELHEENQHLQSHLNMVREVRDEVIKENEQLKQENRKLKEDLEHCANQFTNDGKNVLLSLR